MSFERVGSREVWKGQIGTVKVEKFRHDDGEVVEREVIAHPHLLARQAFPEVTHPTRGHVRVTASPYHWDGRPIHPAGPAPYRVGEHSRLVLSGLLGYDASRIGSLIASGAVEVP